MRSGVNPVSLRSSAAERRLKVVVVDHVARLSGGEIALLRVLPVLAEEFDVHVVLGEDGPLAAAIRQTGVPTTVLPLSTRVRDARKDELGARAEHAQALAETTAYARRLAGRLKALGADVVHTNSLKSGIYGGFAARLARVPAVWHLRDRLARDYLPPAALLATRGALRLLPRVVVVNSNTTLLTVPESVRRRVPVRVVPDAVDRPAEPAAIRPEVNCVGVVGRLASWKGQHVFLDAFAAAFGGTAVRGRIVGAAMFGEERYERTLREQAERLGIADRIEFRGFRHDVWTELRELDVLIHCSTIPEPFGQVVLEGIAAGVPVVAPDTGGPAEILRDGVEGLLTPPGDVARLAESMRRLAGDLELRVALADAGRTRSLEFSPARAARSLGEAYREATARASGAGA